MFRTRSTPPRSPRHSRSPTACISLLKVDIETTRATVEQCAGVPAGADRRVRHCGRALRSPWTRQLDSLAPSQIGQIHPGADDNASGTAGVLELARLLAPERGQLKRGILFTDFAGEELGLLGSAEWVKEPTHPLDKAIAMINMDMIGRIKDDKVYIGGVGTGSTFKTDSGASAERKREKSSAFKIEYSAGGYSSSDHTSFVDQKNSRAVLLLRTALRLSQALRHLGQNQCPLGGEAARSGRKCNGATGECQYRRHAEVP